MSRIIADICVDNHLKMNKHVDGNQIEMFLFITRIVLSTAELCYVFTKSNLHFREAVLTAHGKSELRNI